MSEGRLIKNKLRIVRQVGRGGMGYVYEAFHEGLRVTRALKQIVGDLQDNPDIERRFLHEAQMMARLEHPHIVRVFDIDSEPDFGTYLLMEFIRGRDLGELLRDEGRFSYAETLRIGIAVAGALDCAHRAGLVHRDIKPANILIEDGTGRPVVTDFGIAKEVENVGDESFTRTGSFVGTYRYSSREQIRSEKGVPIDGRADVYSLGVVLYEIFAGRKYLAGMPELKIASCVGYQDDWLPSLDYPDPPPPRFGTLIDECLAPDRDKRIRSAAGLMQRLEECRRLDLLDVDTGAGRSPAEATLAASSATSATTQTEPAQTAGLSEVTSTALADSRSQETSQWVGLLQGLRGSVDDQAGEFERLLKELIELDLPRDDFRQLDDMSQILSRVERAESEGQYQEAASNLQGLSDRIQQLNGRIEQTLGGAIESNTSELRQTWRELAVGAGDLLPVERSRAFEQLLAPLPSLLEAGEWLRGRETLREARTQLEQAQRDTRAAASQRVAGALAELREGFAALASRSQGAVAATGVDVEAVAREAGAAIEQGALVAALRLTSDALQRVREAAQALDRDERARVEAGRTSADRARAALDAAEAQVLAATALQQADGMRARAEAAAGRGDQAVAARDFEQASALYAQVAESVRSATASQIAGARDALAAALEDAASAPAEVVGDARRSAQRLLGGELPRERKAALQAVQGAREALARGLADLEPFVAARDNAAAARAAMERATAIGAAKGDLVPAQRIVDDAAAKLARRDFTAARDGFAQAAAAFAQVGEVVVERGEAERLTAARAQIDDGLTALDTTLAGELCAAEIERALRSRDAADAAERSGDRATALTASGEALAALRDASQALLSGLGERSRALDAELDRLSALAGELLPAERRVKVEDGVAAIERALAQRDARRAAAALDEAWRELGDARVDAGERTRAFASDGLGRIRAMLAELATSGEDAAVTGGIDADALSRKVDTLLGEESFAAAYTSIADAIERVRTALDATRERQRDLLRAAKSAATAAQRAIDLDAARELAAAELAASDQIFAAAARAEAAGDGVTAARLYGDATAAAQQLRDEVRTRQIAGYEAERAALEELVARAAGAAEEIVGRARGDARALIEGTVSGDLRQASAAVQKSRAALEKLLAEAAQFATAREQQTLARAAEQRVAALSPSRRQLKVPANLERDADAGFARKTWPAAADAYARALQAWTALEAELGTALEKERAAAQAKTEAEQRAAAEKKKAADLAAARERERVEAESAAKARAAEAAILRQREREAMEAQEKERRDQAALEAKQREAQERASREARARERAATEARAGKPADAAVAGASDATVLGDLDATVVGRATDETRIERQAPAAARRGLPVPALAGGAVLLIAAVGVVVWLSREPTRPAEIAKVQDQGRDAKKVQPQEKATAQEAQPQEKATAQEAPPLQEPAKKQEQAVAPEPLPSAQPVPEPSVAKAPPIDVANIAPPSPIAPPPLRISGFTPDAPDVAVKEGAKQAFSIDVAGGAAGSKPKIAWQLDDRVVARDVTRFEYAPGFDAASEAPRNLEVVVGDGADAQTRSWRVAVANVNRKPQLTTMPKAGTKIDAKLGDTLELTANVKDEDGDPIKYAWKIDGKAVANDAAKLDVPVTGDRSVSVTASDSSADVSATWQIAAIKPILRLDTQPAKLDRLRFEKPQDFALSVPPGTSGLDSEWTVDGKKVASGARYTFANDDPGKVRRTPVEIAVNARDAQGATFERKWNVIVEPPPPQVTDTTPAPGSIEAASGSSASFELAANRPIGGQDLSYVFQVDGKQAAKGKNPSFQYRVSDDRPHRITGFVQDNFDQASAKTEWSIAPAPRPGLSTAAPSTGGGTGAAGDVVRSAQSWLDDYQQAFNSKNAQRLGQLRGLSPDKVAELQKVLDDQEGLRVTFSNVRIDKIDDQRARITYTRSDDFTDGRGTPVSRTGTVEQVVGVVNGRVTELETRRR